MGRPAAGPKRKPGRPSNAELLHRFANSHRQPEPGAGATPPPQLGSSSGSGLGRGRGRGRGQGDSSGRPPSAPPVCPSKCLKSSPARKASQSLGPDSSLAHRVGQVWMLGVRPRQLASSSSALECSSRSPWNTHLKTGCILVLRCTADSKQLSSALGVQQWIARLPILRQSESYICILSSSSTFLCGRAPSFVEGNGGQHSHPHISCCIIKFSQVPERVAMQAKWLFAAVPAEEDQHSGGAAVRWAGDPSLPAEGGL